MRRPLPPLPALRAFEAAARLGGFVAAARELGLSPPAISLQVKNYEAFVGATLFRRRASGVTLTAAGEAAFRAAAEALDALAAAPAAVAGEPAPARVVLSASPSMVTHWLAVAAAGLLAETPELRLELRDEPDPVSFARDGIDLRLAYGAHVYPDHAVTPLFTDALTPVAAPSSGLDLDDPAALDDARLIHLRWWSAHAAYPGWADWFAHVGAPRVPALARASAAGLSGAALDLAAQGAGVALGQLFLAAPLIAAGRLVAATAPPLPLPHAFALVAPRGRARRPEARRLAERLVETARAAAAAAGLPR